MARAGLGIRVAAMAPAGLGIRVVGMVRAGLGKRGLGRSRSADKPSILPKVLDPARDPSTSTSFNSTLIFMYNYAVYFRIVVADLVVSTEIIVRRSGLILGDPQFLSTTAIRI
jgi:hypothetical protein